MLVKSEPFDYSLSVEAITELETEIFRKELFETALSAYGESSGDDDFLQHFPSDIKLCDNSNEPWSSPDQSCSSSGRSSSTTDDKSDIMDHIASGFHLQDDFDFSELLTPQELPSSNITQVLQSEQFSQALPQPPSPPAVKYQVCSTTTLHAPVFSTQSSTTATTLNCSTTLNSLAITFRATSIASDLSAPPTAFSVTNSCRSPVLSTSSSPPLRGCSPVIIKTEDAGSPPLSVAWQQLLCDTTAASTKTVNSIPSGTLNPPKFRIIKAEPTSTSSSPVVNLVSSTPSPDSPGPVFGIKSSPPSSPYSPQSPPSGGVSPPRFKVVSITASRGNQPLLSRNPTVGAVTKIKKIQPKVSMRSLPPHVFGAVATASNIGTSRTGVSSPAPPCGGPPLLPSTCSSTANAMVLSQQVKVLKRHERMIKNRESASLSRKKKKEYVTSLENEIRAVKAENASLKQEVSSLRGVLNSLQQQCAALKDRMQGGAGVRTAPSSRTASSALLLAVCCLVVLNVPGLLPSSPPRSGAHHLLQPPSATPHTSPPRPFARQRRHLLWEDGDEPANASSAIEYFNSTMCPSLLNETESLRLESELRDWFDSTLGRQWAGQRASAPAVQRPPRPTAATPVPSTGLSSRVASREGTRTWRRDTSEEGSGVRSLSPPLQRLVSLYRRYLHDAPLTIPHDGRGSVAGLLEGPSPSAPRSLLELLQSRPDFFYVVSLSRDLILLPAALPPTNNTTTTARPKMTLLLPAPLRSNNTNADAGQATMLQIDCEVLETSLRELTDVDLADGLKDGRDAWEDQSWNGKDRLEEKESSYKSTTGKRRFDGTNSRVYRKKDSFLTKKKSHLKSISNTSLLMEEREGKVVDEATGAKSGDSVFGFAGKLV